ncbi:hypothetical protein ACFTSF_04645 [Kribbella sp. NPDC056951]|uniref:hypothetical protein n=1 Tax=Kribbella sp. NPDC056951 TaxID=3345978 RepID=UPI0036332A46
MPAKQEIHIRWWAIAVVTLIGLGITALPFILARWVDGEYGAWESLGSSALTNIGTAILLVAVVFLVERGLVRRVQEVARQQATAIVDERTQELTDTNRDLSIRIDALQAQLEQSVADEDSERRARADQLSKDVSFDTVAEALEQANDLRALAWGEITVPASIVTTGPRVTLSWRPHSSGGMQLSLDDIFANGEPRLLLHYEASHSPDGGIGIPVVEVAWDPRQSPVQALHALRDEMRRRGFGEEAKLVGDKLFQNLHAAVTEAMAARTGAENAWATGAMYEWLRDGWAVTERGLVSRDHGIVESGAFPRTARQKAYGTDEDRGVDAYTRPVPDGVDPGFWSFALERAGEVHPRTGWSGSGDSRPSAYTPSTSPRSRSEWNESQA